ncbi:MAG: tRNA pseudouridine(38-40) synthase TruA [Acidiferrobacterales bacterium]|nr:tRNA pseudouridine(38-40) synthase TruA [Acidiferrobacterales bacterium]
MRIAAIVEYDGSDFSGWQLQDGVRTIQGVIETALSKVADTAVRVIVAGRTDAGVHASWQVLHFDTTARRKNYEWLRGANSGLPGDVALLWVDEVDPSFNARLSASGRRYQYVNLNRNGRPTYLRRRGAGEYRALDISAMQRGARHLIGTHDFSSFRAVQCQAKDPVRELRALKISRRGEFVLIDAYADAFLHHMVRNIAGVLLSIGAGERKANWAREVLQAHDRTAGGVTAAPDGLYLVGVEYPRHYGLPEVSLCWGF